MCLLSCSLYNKPVNVGKVFPWVLWAILANDGAWGGVIRARSLCLVCCSVNQSCPTLCDPVDCNTPGFPVLHCLRSLFKLMSIELVMPSNHLILCCPLLLLPLIFPSIKVFSNESALRIRFPKYWSFSSASVPPMNIQGWFPLGLTGLISLQYKGLSKSLLQQHSSKASILWCSSCFMVQLSYPYMNSGKTIALTMQTFVSKERSLLFNTLGF